MTRMFAFLRAINTGSRRLTNEQVLEPFAALGLVRPAAYQAAGNVTFSSDVGPQELERLIETTLSESYGFDAATFVRTAAELQALLETPPFAPAVVAGTQGRTQITFVKSAPDEDQRSAVLSLVPDDDAVEMGQRHWFWLPRAGVSESELPVSRIERILGPSTMRTLGTVERMLAKYGET